MVTMKMSPAFRSPRSALGSIESGNKLSNRPVVRQSKLYREKESGNAMKGIFGQDNLQWDTEKQEGVFGGQSVYDASTHAATAQAGGGRAAASAAPGPSAEAPLATGGAEPEYPLPGSSASCDACGQVVDRYYHCAECQEHTGLFDLCVRCCGAIYLQGGRKIPHPTHDYVSHTMQHVVPVR